MAKHYDLCLQRGSESEKPDQPAPDQPAELVHRAKDSADSLPQANRISRSNYVFDHNIILAS
jgi:hypothetical protein